MYSLLLAFWREIQIPNVSKCFPIYKLERERELESYIRSVSWLLCGYNTRTSALYDQELTPVGHTTGFQSTGLDIRRLAYIKK